MAPVPNTAMFMAMVWAPFLARTKPGLEQREAGLHEHHQRGADDDPHQVGVLGELVGADGGAGATSWANAELASTVTSTAAMRRADQQALRRDQPPGERPATVRGPSRRSRCVGHHRASASRSPVRTRTTRSTAIGPDLAVADLAGAGGVGDGVDRPCRRRRVAERPRCGPWAGSRRCTPSPDRSRCARPGDREPLTSLTVMPVHARSPRSASFTSSSLNGLITAVTRWTIGASFVPPGLRPRPADAAPARPASRQELAHGRLQTRSLNVAFTAIGQILTFS